MAADNRQAKDWLVKSSTRILGPYTTADIGQLLLNKHISLIDEVRTPQGRWRYVREHLVFAEAVAMLRAEQESSPEHTQSVAAGHQFQSDELTPTPVPSGVLRSDMILHPAPIKDVRATSESDFPASDAAGGRGAANTFGIRGTGPEAAPKSSLFEYKWPVLGLLAIVALTMFGLHLRNNFRREKGYDSLIEDALRYRSEGLYEDSLAAYKKAAQIHEPDNETQTRMALVLIVLDHQNMVGRRLLEKQLQEDRENRPRLIDDSLGIGISYVLEGSLKEGEDVLHTVLTMDPSNFFARLNLALVALRKGDWREAQRSLGEITKKNPPHPLVLLARAVSLFEGHEAPSSDQVTLLAEEIRQQLDHSSALRSEMLTVLLSLQAADDPGYLKNLTSLISELTPAGAYIHDLRLDWRVADWEFLEKICHGRSGTVSSARMKAVAGLCLAEAGREQESHDVMQEAVTETPKDPLVLFAQARLLSRSGLRNEALGGLTRSRARELRSARSFGGTNLPAARGPRVRRTLF